MKAQGVRSSTVTFKFMVEVYLKDDEVSAQGGRYHDYCILQ